MKELIILVFIALLGMFISEANATPKPVIVVIGQSNAVGMYESGVFQKAYKHHKVISCSHGGEKIEKFLPGSKYMKLCIKQIGNGIVDKVIFWQGESDTTTEQDAVSWHKKVNIVLSEIIKKHGTKKTKLVSVVINNFQDLDVWKHWNVVRAQQLRMKSIKIDSSNYEFEPVIHFFGVDVYSPIHLTKDGYKKISVDISRKLIRR